MYKIITALVGGLLAANIAVAQKTADIGIAPKPLTALGQAAQTFWRALSPTQQQKAGFAMTDNERQNWHYVPKDRQGLPLKEMTESQRKLAMAMLEIPLSQQGYRKAQAIMELEVVLKALENLPPDNNYRDPDKYYFTFFGKPGSADPWGWRVEGHHLSLNFSSVSNEVISLTPAFMGANPAIVPQGPEKGKQILKQETELGFALFNALTPGQQQQALLAEKAPNEIITGNSRRAILEKYAGVPYSAMTPTQQKLLQQLLGLYLSNYQQPLAQALKQKIEKAGMGQVHFAWAGSREPGPGRAHYYRLHGPVILIEYDNSQNNANHVHTVVRDLTNDFGEDALKAHYQKHQH